MDKDFNFSKVTISKLAVPVKGRDYYRDTKEKGLALSITSKGTITFFLRKRVNGKDERITFGHYPEVAIENARKLALKAKSDVAQGGDPNAERRAIRSDILFGDMFQEYMERYSKRHKKTWKDDESEINKFCSHWLKRKASHITKQEIKKLHDAIGSENGIYQANRVFERIRAIYNWAINTEEWKGSNPTTGIKKHPEKSRERFLSKDEMPRFFAALAEDENNTVRDYILMSLLTGARKGNILAMRWEQVLFKAKEWHIPETKNGEAHTVPLLDAAIEILQERKNLSDSEWVFPGVGRTGHLSDPKRAWQRILKRAEIKDLRLHDLRRTLGSWMAATGATTAIIGKTLAHKTPQATKIYERLDLDPVRQSMNIAQQAMFNAAKSDD